MTLNTSRFLHWIHLAILFLFIACSKKNNPSDIPPDETPASKLHVLGSVNFVSGGGVTSALWNDEGVTTGFVKDPGKTFSLLGIFKPTGAKPGYYGYVRLADVIRVAYFTKDKVVILSEQLGMNLGNSDEDFHVAAVINNKLYIQATGRDVNQIAKDYYYEINSDGSCSVQTLPFENGYNTIIFRNGTLQFISQITKGWNGCTVKISNKTGLIQQFDLVMPGYETMNDLSFATNANGTLCGVFSAGKITGREFFYFEVTQGQTPAAIALPVPQPENYTLGRLLLANNRFYCTAIVPNTTNCYYLTIHNGGTNPTVEKQQLETAGSTGQLQAGPMVVTNNHVYVAGVYNDQACYWNNGKRTSLSNTGILNAFVWDAAWY